MWPWLPGHSFRMEENDPQALTTSVDPVSVIEIIDRDELRAMFPAMLPRLWAFALRLSGGRRCAEEILRLACARALELIRHMHPGSGLIGWLFSIVHRTWIYDIRPHKPRGNSPNWDVNSLQGLTAGDTDDSKTQSDLSCQRILMALTYYRRVNEKPCCWWRLNALAMKKPQPFCSYPLARS